MKNRRVVITGLGVISSLGLNENEWWKNITDGKSAVKRMDMFQEYDISPKPIGAPIEQFELSDFIDNADKYEPYLDRGTKFGFAAASQAFACSGLKDSMDHIDTKKFGIYAGSTTGGICSAFHAGVDFLHHRKQDDVNILYSFPPASWGTVIANYFHADGVQRVVGTSCYAGSEAIGVCYRDLKCGEVDIALAGGMDAPIILTNYLSFKNIGAVSNYKGEASEACRPFSKDRTGMVFGEGSAFFTMETLESAQKRGARIYAEIIGYAATSDGESMVQPSMVEDRWADAIKEALKEANVSPEEIDYVSCHGTGTKLNDKAEARAISHALAQNKKVKIGSIKSMIGHSFGGACALEVAQILKTFETNVLPPTINYNQPDEECDFDVVPNKKITDYPCKYILKTATGFGGSNLAIVFKRWEEE